MSDLQEYSNLCATYGDIKIRILQLQNLLQELTNQAIKLEKKLIQERSELKVEGVE